MLPSTILKLISVFVFCLFMFSNSLNLVKLFNNFGQYNITFNKLKKKQIKMPPKKAAKKGAATKGKSTNTFRRIY